MAGQRKDFHCRSLPGMIGAQRDGPVHGPMCFSTALACLWTTLADWNFLLTGDVASSVTSW